jgi:large subunit ribosomal protein L23
MAKATAAAASHFETKSGLTLSVYDIVVKPVITEKSTLLSENNQVMFRVHLKATKPQIRSAIEQLFNVKVTGINTQVRKGKTKRWKGTEYIRSDYKQAVVTLAAGQSIDVTTGI